MLNRATAEGLISPITNRNARLRISLYADAAAMFLLAVLQD
jgi:hypothetical protein